MTVYAGVKNAARRLKRNGQTKPIEIKATKRFPHGPDKYLHSYRRGWAAFHRVLDSARAPI